MLSEIPVPKGTVVQIGVQGSNMNKALWGKDALEWKPERWINGLPAAVEEAKIPGVYSHLYVPISRNRIAQPDCSSMTFLGGGRSCMYVLFFRDIPACFAFRC